MIYLRIRLLISEQSLPIYTRGAGANRDLIRRIGGGKSKETMQGHSQLNEDESKSARTLAREGRDTQRLASKYVARFRKHNEGNLEKQIVTTLALRVQESQELPAPKRGRRIYASAGAAINFLLCIQKAAYSINIGMLVCSLLYVFPCQAYLTESHILYVHTLKDHLQTGLFVTSKYIITYR